MRMCPIFRFAPAEEASPRAKANLMRAVLSGQLDPQSLASERVQDRGRLVRQLPDVPARMSGRCRYSQADDRGQGPLRSLERTAHRRLDPDAAGTVGAIGGLLSPFANWIIRNRQARWLVEKAFGIAQGRKLPRFASRSFLRRAARRRLTQPTRRSGRKVLYFVDTYANYHDPQLAEALVAVLEHNGVPVYVHPDQRASRHGYGIAWGDRRRPHHRHRKRAILAEAVRQGYTIVTAEPSAALCLTHEYPLVARRRRDATGRGQYDRSLSLPVADAPDGQVATRFPTRSMPRSVTINPAT